MKTRVLQQDFVHAFLTSPYRNKYSIKGLENLFDQLEQWEEDFGEERELDLLEIVGEYTEATPNEIADEYDLGIDENEPNLLEKVLEKLPNRTFVVCSFKDENDKDKIIYANF